MSSRNQVLSLYRSLLRASKTMPTENRQIYVARLAREGIEKERNNNNPDEVNFLIRVGYGHEDTILTQAKHLTQLLEQGILREYDYK